MGLARGRPVALGLQWRLGTVRLKCPGTGEEIPVRNALKAVGAAIAVIGLCSPLIFWPAEDAQTMATQLSQATVTVPATVVVATTLSPSKTEAALEPSSTTTTTEPPIDITIAAVGDVLTHMPIVDSVRDPTTGSYDFWPVFKPIAPYLTMADYAVANLETRLAGPEFKYSGYPLFNSPGELADALRYAGIDLVGTANNHSLDMGLVGLANTLDRLDKAGLSHVGTYRSLEEKTTPFIVDIQGVKVAFLNYTSYLNGQGVAEEQKEYAVNMLDVDEVAREAMIARMWGADIVIALLHYGNYGDEYARQPSASQVDMSGEILRHGGVDVILGTQPHVVQPIAHIFDFSSWRANDKYVAYSLGNFVSNQRWRYSDSGLIAYVHIQKKGMRASVTGISYLPVYVQRSTEQSTVRYRVLPVLPGSQPETDTALTTAEEERMAQVWEELRALLYRPDENIEPLDPADLGL
jgi:poly-gamma-glutamate capsule biosynthesis protein CapA/YwtB (metallophosphatase superfamily)